MNVLDARNPHMVPASNTLDSRNPHARTTPQDPRVYVAPYQFQEYPKYVELADGTGIVVENAEEEAAARGDEDDEVAEETVAGAPVKKVGRPSKAELAARRAAEQENEA